MSKILARVIKEEIYNSFESHRLFLEEREDAAWEQEE